MFFTTFSNRLGTTHPKYRCTAKALIFFRRFTSSISPRKTKTSFERRNRFFYFSVLQNLADRPLKTRYVVATDTSKETLIRLSRKVSQTLGTGKTKVFEQEEAMLNRDIAVTKFLRRTNERDEMIFQQADYDMLATNMQFEPMFIKEQMNIKWHCENGLAENIVKVVEEYRRQRNLLVREKTTRREDHIDLSPIVLADQNLHSRSSGLGQNDDCAPISARVPFAPSANQRRDRRHEERISKILCKTLFCHRRVFRCV